MDLNGHSAIVTGGGSGLGEATARLLAAKGMKVAIWDLNLDGANRVAGEIGGVAIQCDVSDAGAAEAAIEQSRAAVGTARVLVNCAGIGPPRTIVSRDGEPMPLGDFQTVIQVNLIGTFNCLRLAAADMSKAEPLDGGERGVIINTASVAAFEGQIGQAAYSASKGGVVGLMVPAMRELGRHGIRVLTIAPGYVETPLLEAVPKDFQENLKSSQIFPRARFGQPEEYAGLCVHICENQLLNGDTIRLDAGTRMPPR
ncbi:MAG: SDR family NAD(P)-dependent oxidoreductase [Rhodospirillaceae bacterium]|nr:SDR family NAD(P)-dependent oxidoreductase [Rhodospirillaceae bacterium]MYB14772.1 SDR family NAD(P)-dependent oxidoreductase [Rhodospirillaceae bacterium]MYI50099.1 SDR family NAD(P)-dependent oxidoreductase [Rhodospirillaceae bacterium]